MKKIISKKSGFTLIETLVAIFVLIIAITATFTSANLGLKTSFEARDQVIASFLSQEAYEILRNMRDKNRISGSDWLPNAALVACNGQDCQIDMRDPVDKIKVCGTACRLYKDSQGFYTHQVGGGNTPTKFTRSLQLLPIDNRHSNTGVTAIVTVSWTEGSRTKSMTSRLNLLDWK